MQNNTRLLYNALLQQIAAINGVQSAAEKFNVAPSVQQKLETRIQESSDFLKRINMIGVTEKYGAKLGLGIGGPIASTTNTDVMDRTTTEVPTLDEHVYECTQTNFDTHIKYNTLDAWAKFPDFQARVRDALVKRQALDRIIIGFNGVTRAATSNRVANPLLQDVNKGWLQHIREDAPERVLSGGATAGTIKIGGTGADYANLDALVMDAASEMLDPWYRNDTQIVAIMGGNLLHDKYFPLVNSANAPTEQLALDTIISQKRVGGRSGAQVPHVPDGTILLTRFDNLSLYYQDGARRRHVTDNPKRDRIENWESSNDAYVVEDYGAAVLIENIELQ